MKDLNATIKMIVRAHLVKLLHQFKSVQVYPLSRFSTEFPEWTPSITRTEAQSDDFLKYGLYSFDFGHILNFNKN